ncbi:GtrA family protein [Carnobacterium viridans]|uniref:Putative flippase GtrA (Transmembrane translocase of bactoprenol-linked glucose) n=1 Tax=Carnobacterium viridans TaxID=174587 RepID=A0A1H0YYB1_9LACT|nr:GtrA family protein [Carnobacterium viridans]UDE94881.1 GtrA family protein [Carnobacterium viridans]SDQ20257.1 Putative flippase GtrA (transmembrane translocase of bactoprenol-linked glucose) [Carnobacterium viridans]
MTKIKRFVNKYEEVIGYLIFGGLTTVVNIIVFYLFDSVFDVHYLVANAIAIVVSILFAFFTNKKYVFKSSTPTVQLWLKEFSLFVSFRLLSAVFDMGSMWLLVDGLNLNANVAKIITQFIVVVLNYAFSKFFIFKQGE